MGTISKPESPKKTSSVWFLIVPVIVVVALVGYFVIRERSKVALAPTASVPVSVASSGNPAPATDGDTVDQNAARAAVEAYFSAAAVSDFQKMAELTGGEESHPIVGGYTILRDVGCEADSGKAEDVRWEWEVVFKEAAGEESLRKLRESIPEWRSTATNEAATALSRKHPLLVDIVMSSAGGFATLTPEFFATDGPFLLTACTFLVDAEFQSKAGTRLWKRQNVTAFVATSEARKEAPWIVGARKDIGGS